MPHARPADLSFVIVLSIVLGFCLISIGCDDRPTPPPEPAAPTSVPAPVITTGPLSLGLLPFTVDVPSNWKVNRYGENPLTARSMLEGPLPDGEAHLMLGLRENVSGGILKLMVERARKDSAEIIKAGGDVRVREIGAVQIIERRRMPNPASQPADTPVDWRVTLFVPSGVGYEQYEIKVIDLPVTTLSNNQAMIESIFSSLKHDDAPLPPM